MNEFNRLLEFAPSQSPEVPSSPKEKDKPNKQKQHRLVLDEVRLPPQEEKNYQDNLEQYIAAQEKMDDLNARMNMLNLEKDFWRGDDIFKNIDQLTLD